jgi:hypothetical protein
MSFCSAPRAAIPQGSELTAWGDPQRSLDLLDSEGGLCLQPSRVICELRDDGISHTNNGDRRHQQRQISGRYFASLWVLPAIR